LSRQVITLKVLNDQSHAAQLRRVITIVFEKARKKPRIRLFVGFVHQTHSRSHSHFTAI